SSVTAGAIAAARRSDDGLAVNHASAPSDAACTPSDQAIARSNTRQR
ncbi:MAG: hypothetical protein JWM53_4103, partial [bacterium]|nr:hypothetical protein [bacterium]